MNKPKHPKKKSKSIKDAEDSLKNLLRSLDGLIEFFNDFKRKFPTPPASRPSQRLGDKEGQIQHKNHRSK